MLKKIATIGLFMILVSSAPARKALSASTGTDPTITVRVAEEHWNKCIMKRDTDCASGFLAENYRLLIDVEGQPLIKIPRDVWLKNLPAYFIEEMSFQETDVYLHSDIAVVTLRYSQKGHTAGSRDINGNFMLTDVWIKTAKGWKVAQRNSCRAEKLPPQNK